VVVHMMSELAPDSLRLRVGVRAQRDIMDEEY